MKKRVLILCTGNSCRSQMAEALWRSLAGAEWDCFSAGSRPAGYVYPLAVQVMREVGIDISSAASKGIDVFKDQSFDLVVTVCDNAKEDCPILPGAARTLHWPFEDPAMTIGSDSERLPHFRRVRHQIQKRIEEYLSRGV